MNTPKSVTKILHVKIDFSGFIISIFEIAYKKETKKARWLSAGWINYSLEMNYFSFFDNC